MERLKKLSPFQNRPISVDMRSNCLRAPGTRGPHKVINFILIIVLMKRN